MKPTLCTLAAVFCLSALAPSLGAGAAETTPLAKAIGKRLPRMIEMVRIPASPFRLRVNLGPVANAVGKPAEPLDVFLYRDDRVAVEFGRADSENKLLSDIKITLKPEDQEIYNRETVSGFELRVYNAQQELVVKQKVLLLITRAERVGF